MDSPYLEVLDVAGEGPWSFCSQAQSEPTLTAPEPVPGTWESWTSKPGLRCFRRLFLAGAWPVDCGHSERQGADGRGWVCRTRTGGMGGGGREAGHIVAPCSEEEEGSLAGNRAASVPRPPLPAGSPRTRCPPRSPRAGRRRDAGDARGDCGRRLGLSPRRYVPPPSPGPVLFLSPPWWGPQRACGQRPALVPRIQLRAFPRAAPPARGEGAGARPQVRAGRAPGAGPAGACRRRAGAAAARRPGGMSPPAVAAGFSSHPLGWLRGHLVITSLTPPPKKSQTANSSPRARRHR